MKVEIVEFTVFLSGFIGLPTNWLRILLFDGTDKSCNHLVANLILYAIPN